MNDPRGLERGEALRLRAGLHFGLLVARERDRSEIVRHVHLAIDDGEDGAPVRRIDEEVQLRAAGGGGGQLRAGRRLAEQLADEEKDRAALVQHFRFAVVPGPNHLAAVARDAQDAFVPELNRGATVVAGADDVASPEDLIGLRGREGG